MIISKADVLKELKSHVASLGFTFKVNDKKMIDNNTCYMLIKRYSDNEVIVDKWGKRLSNFTLDNAYECMQTGYFIKLAQDEKHFNSL